ncbi:MAG: shikimate kinase [Clostridia bacterium]|nr:shikimate kinase [Clostridia bacterium]
MNVKSGLLGEKLSHSYSPEIHAELGAYPYRLFEVEPENVERFLFEGDFTGINVTIPYKKTVLPYMDEVSDTVKATGSVNTVLKRKDGSFYGDNTDVYGFTQLVLKSGIDAGGKKALVLGSGGSSLSVVAALKKLGANVVVISRSGENNYQNLHLHRDARLIVNTTPLGMYPNNGAKALSLKSFDRPEGVIDLIYNPSRTALMLEADEMGIPAENGLYMLVAQAKRSSELFCASTIPDSETERIYRLLSRRMRNIALIGMPGSGKSTAAENLSRITGRPVLDCDAEFTRRYGNTPAEVIRLRGESAFRELETQILSDLSKHSAAIISTGGGCVTREENYRLLRQNSVTVWLRRELKHLSTTDRPISQAKGVESLYNERAPLYERFADVSAEVQAKPTDTASRILSALDEMEAAK